MPAARRRHAEAARQDARLRRGRGRWWRASPRQMASRPPVELGGRAGASPRWRASSRRWTGPSRAPIAQHLRRRWRRERGPAPVRVGGGRPAELARLDDEAAADGVVGALHADVARRRRGRAGSGRWRGRAAAGRSRRRCPSRGRRRARRRPSGARRLRLARRGRPARSASSGSTLSGRRPAKPRSTARSVAWPLPVKASEPCSTACRRASGPVPGFSLGSRRTSRKRAAATIGPIVCDDDGPMPILKMSKTLRNIVSTLWCGVPQSRGEPSESCSRVSKHASD